MAQKKAVAVGAGDFKTRCLSIIEETREHHKSFIITKRGVPVARLVPFDEEPKELFGCLKGTLKMSGDIVEPLDVKWEAEQ